VAALTPRRGACLIAVAGATAIAGLACAHSPANA
jgi:hypothetical protein